MSAHSGETAPEALADLARGRRRNKAPERAEAWRGLMGDHQRFLPAIQPERIVGPDAQIGQLDPEVARRLDPFEDTVAVRDTIPGVGRRTAAVIAAAAGSDVAAFPTPRHLAA